MIPKQVARIEANPFGNKVNRFHLFTYFTTKGIILSIHIKKL